MTRYRTSTGELISKSYIDRMVRIVKEMKILEQLDEYGFNFCQCCGKSSEIRLDCSHIKSVDSCQKEGISELAYDKLNIRILCRTCHQSHDRLNLRFNE